MNFLSKLAREITPYVPGEQPQDKKYIKLNTNENPYPPSPQVITSIKTAANDRLRLYPEPTAHDLRTIIADHYRLKNNEVFIGNGSDEVLAFSFMAFFNPDDTILFPDITYSFYKVYSSLFKVQAKFIKLSADLTIPVEEFKREDNHGIIFPNPNAPTGIFLDLKYVEEIVKENREQVVIIDEAYVDFGGDSAVRLIENYPNLLIINTTSKSRSLAGLRVGFALGQKDLIEGLNRIKNSINSYTIDRLAMTGAVAAFKDDEYYRVINQKIVETRKMIVNELQEIGFKVIPSLANFIFISHPEVKAESLFINLKSRGILVRYFNQERIDNYLRVSIGTDYEMQSFFEKINELI